MQFCDRRAQNLKNANIDMYECPYGKFQCHQPTLSCLKKELYFLEIVNLRLESKLLNLAKAAEVLEGLIKTRVSST